MQTIRPGATVRFSLTTRMRVPPIGLLVKGTSLGGMPIATDYYITLLCSRRCTMKRLVLILAFALVVAPSLTNVDAAGRVGGPMSSMSTAPAGASVYFDIPFIGDEPAVVTINGDGRSILHLYLYDGDGHVAVGDGSTDRKTATMNVYRTGTFRVEVRNIGNNPDNFVITTN